MRQVQPNTITTRLTSNYRIIYRIFFRSAVNLDYKSRLNGNIRLNEGVCLNKTISWHTLVWAASTSTICYSFFYFPLRLRFQQVCERSQVLKGKQTCDHLLAILFAFTLIFYNLLRSKFVHWPGPIEEIEEKMLQYTYIRIYSWIRYLW